jgi:hypothetical protein
MSTPTTERDLWAICGMTIAATSAAVASFAGLRGLASAAGWPEHLAWLLPVTVDAYASPTQTSAPVRHRERVGRNRRQRRRQRGLPRGERRPAARVVANRRERRRGPSGRTRADRAPARTPHRYRAERRARARGRERSRIRRGVRPESGRREQSRSRARGRDSGTSQIRDSGPDYIRTEASDSSLIPQTPPAPVRGRPDGRGPRS